MREGVDSAALHGAMGAPERESEHRVPRNAMGATVNAWRWKVRCGGFAVSPAEHNPLYSQVQPVVLADHATMTVPAQPTQREHERERATRY